MSIRVATFNIENLFTRFDFSGFLDEKSSRYLPPVVNFLAPSNRDDLGNFDEFKDIATAASVSQDDDKRQHTALAIREADADIVCLQEVDSVEALTRFRDFYVKKTSQRSYKQLALIEGNDRRGIDVAALADAKTPMYTRSHAWITPSWFGKAPTRSALIDAYPLIEKPMKARRRIFRRDCQEIEVRDGERPLTIFNCHFKSMSGGRKDSIGVRQLEALAVKTIIERKFADPASANWAVVGDLNDYRAQIKVRSDDSEEFVTLEAEKPSGLDPLLDDGFSVNLVDRLPEDARWTHYYSGRRTKTQLDYILVSPAMAAANPGVPTILRSGQPYRVPNSDDIARYPRVGWDRPKCSDHSPVVMDLELPAGT